MRRLIIWAGVAVLSIIIASQTLIGCTTIDASHEGIKISKIGSDRGANDIENVTGWSIGPHPDTLGEVEDVDKEDFEDMYNKLEYIILLLYYDQRDQWIRVMRHAIAINGSFFNTHRMVQQYVLNAYFQ